MTSLSTGEDPSHLRIPDAARGVVLALVFLGSLTCAIVAEGLDVLGVQPYALSHPRVPACLSQVGEEEPLFQYSKELDRKFFAFWCFLDTAASRIVLSKQDREALKVETTGETVEDIGIGGKEAFDVSRSYVLRVGDSSTDLRKPEQFPFSLSCKLEMRRKEPDALSFLPKGVQQQLGGELDGLGMNMSQYLQAMVPAINLVGTPFLKKHVAILDPRPVAEASTLVSGLMLGGDEGGDLMTSINKLLDQFEAGVAEGDPLANLDKLLKEQEAGGGARGLMGFGNIKVEILSAEKTYKEPSIVIPLYMKSMEPEPIPVTNAEIPFVRNVELARGEKKVMVELALDTGGAVSLMSGKVATDLGLDLDKPDLTTTLMGVGAGSTELKGFWLDKVTLQADKGGPLVYHRAPFFIVNIERLQGTIGANMIIPSIYIDMNALTGGDGLQGGLVAALGVLATMKSGPMPFKRIVIDLPKGRLGLDPASESPQPASPRKP